MQGFYEQPQHWNHLPNIGLVLLSPRYSWEGCQASAQSHALDCNFVSVPCRTSIIRVSLYRKVECWFQTQRLAQYKFQSAEVCAEVPKVWYSIPWHCSGKGSQACDQFGKCSPIFCLVPLKSSLQLIILGKSPLHLLQSQLFLCVKKPRVISPIKQQWQENLY